MSSKKVKWLVDPEELIAQVQYRPILYDTTITEYSNKALKAEYWMQVAEILSDDWRSLSKGQRSLRCREVQAKWKHLRDNFRRECQRLSEVNKSDSKKKRYRYYERLTFLIPHVKSGLQLIAEQSHESQAPICMDYFMCEEDPEIEFLEENLEEEEEIDGMAAVSAQKMRSSFDDSSKFESAEFDEDRAFCLSLVQSIKNLDDDEKLSAKIEILNVIRKFKQQVNNNRAFNEQYVSESQSEVKQSNSRTFSPVYNSGGSSPAYSFGTNDRMTSKIRRKSQDDPLASTSIAR